MNNLEWAKREIELACQKEDSYGCACYESALKVFESLCSDDHTGCSISQTAAILNRLISGMPLTPIEDTDDVWGPALHCHYGRYPYNHGAGVTTVTEYHCKRRPSLSKQVHSDGTVKYYDKDYVVCADIDEPHVTYSLGLVSNVIHDMFPITMPYFPGKPIFVLCDCFLTDKANGVFDTVGIFSAFNPNEIITDQTKFTKIDKFFREASEDEEEPWIEITKDEYYKRKAKYVSYQHSQRGHDNV